MTLSDYLDMFPSASREKAKYIALASAVLDQVIDLQKVVAEVAEAYTIDEASGAQLDVVAASLGLSRNDTSAGLSVSDATFRDFLKKKMIHWAWDGTNKTAPVLAKRIAANSVLTDNMNCTVSLTGAGSQPASNKSIFPITAGVRIA